ncbi:DNA repair protein RecO [Saccharibacter sp. 17.LH.SD]|uniref:DNA repair protein RecO n=1 Tax=Saccharibacter sp. 17.LH.SD TaxID=2689393 RepID=UPI00136F1B28|nr:DNA repair protein RecO [Saccharibacter sp. 17.LH.SD]
MEWEEPAIVLRTTMYGETGLLVYLLTQEQGVCRGLVKGGMSRRQRATWQVGTLIVARWRARLPEQLGALSGEVVRHCAAPLLYSALGLGLLSSACTLCAEALPEKEAYPALFTEMVRFLSVLSVSPENPPIADYARWECFLLKELGYGLDLSRCAVTGHENGLCYVSPRTGRAVSDEGAGEWRDRLLPLPSFLFDETDGTPSGWQDALTLTGYFLRRAVFAAHHRPLPAARQRLADMVRDYSGAIEKLDSSF